MKAALLVFALTAAVFAPTLGYDFQRAWDDGGMLLFNNHLTSWSWAFMLQSLYFGHWMPLTWFTWTLDAHLWGLWAGGWHAVNVLLHASSAVLVCVIAQRLTGSRFAAVTTALLFAVHPMRMESVAWITERKDVLSGFFFLLAVLSYLRYAQPFAGGEELRARPGASTTNPDDRDRGNAPVQVAASVTRGRSMWYMLSLACFIAAAMAKCIAVMFVPWIFLLDWAVLRRRAWIEKAPFVLIAGLVSEMAFYAVNVGVHNMLPWAKFGLGPRLLHVAYSNVYYVWRSLWPSRLSHMIEYTWVPSWDQPPYPIAVALILLVAVTLVWLRSRVLTAAVLAYAVAIFPQAGLFHNGPQLLANRYSYLAMLPLTLLVGVGFSMASRRWRGISLASATAALSALVVVTSVHLPMWQNDTTLWTYAAEHEPTCTMCQDWAGVLAYSRGDLQATRRYFERAIPVSLDTDFPRYERYWGLGRVLDELGEREQAAKVLRVYLVSVPPEYRNYGYEQAHMKDAERRLVRLGGVDQERSR